MSYYISDTMSISSDPCPSCSTNTDGSGKAASYVRALDMLGSILTKHYPVPVVKEIKDHYTDAAAKSYFIDREGQTMSLPVKFLPSQSLLEKHRAAFGGMKGVV